MALLQVRDFSPAGQLFYNALRGRCRSTLAVQRTRLARYTQGFMSTLQNFNAFDLLGQSVNDSTAIRLPGRGGPSLEIAWESFLQSLTSSIRTLFDGTCAPKKFLGANYFRDCWIERRVPYRAILAAVLWHVAFILLSPLANLNLAPRRVEAFENTELTWSGPINDLPLLNISSAMPKPKTHGGAEKPMEAKSADAFHPRQRIFSDSAHPTHPRQVLINSAAPPKAPKILPTLPNIVQIQQMAGPARPRLEISEMTIQKLHPREKRRAAVADVLPADVVNFEERPMDQNFALSQKAPAKPRLELNPGAVPRIVKRAQSGDVGPAPEVSDMQSRAANGFSSTFIALAATLAPPASNVAPPPGNLSARITVSPEEKQPSAALGTPNGAPGVGGIGAEKNSVDVSISGGNPPSNNGVSAAGAAAKISALQPRVLFSRPAAKLPSEDLRQRTGPPNFASLPSGAKPEEIFAAKHVYSLNVNMPNLNSATGSWILNFSEMSATGSGSGANAADLAGPAPIRKVDPKYPRTLINEHVEGEVILYAVIRFDGTVDSIQLVRGIDEQLDANAMSALSQWKFRPAEKNGAPVDLEAIVHIPFRAAPTR